MLNRGKIFFSFLFLFVFLIPTVGETLHQLSHADDFHCTEINVHHFHESEHHCSICDFSFTTYYSDIFKPEVKAIGYFIFPYHTLNAHSLFYSEVTTLALRGPPIC